MTAKLTESQLNDLIYFWVEKQDLERWTEFEDLKSSIEEYHPHVMRAWKMYKDGESYMDMVMRDISAGVE